MREPMQQTCVKPCKRQSCTSGHKTCPPPPPPPRKPRLYRIEPLRDGGFSVTSTREPPEGAVLTIGVAYDTAGNPIKQWSPEDFRLDKMTVEIVGGDLVEQSGNKIQARSTGNEALKVKVQGFDPSRDLFVEASLSEDN